MARRETDPPVCDCPVPENEVPRQILRIASLEANRLSRITKALKVRVLAADIPAMMQINAFHCARLLLDEPKTSHMLVACKLKKEFDGRYGLAWHCVVGASFGSFVTHSLGGFLYFSIDKICVLLFRTNLTMLTE